MESDSRMPKEEAARALRVAEAVQARAAGVPRGHAVLQLLYAVMMSAYMALFVYAGSDAVDTDAIGGLLMTLVVPPMIVSTGLINGAGERYPGRLRTAGRYGLAVGVFLAMLGVLLGWRFFGGGYPLWVVPASAVATLVIFGFRPVGILRHPSAEPNPAPAEALPAGTRITTLVIGLGFGAVCATVFVPNVGWIVSSAVMLFTIIALGAASSWSLRSTGWYWGLRQWITFGFASVVILAEAGFLIATDVVTPVVAITTGVVVAASLTISAFLPGRGDPEGESDEADGAPEA